MPWPWLVRRPQAGARRQVSAISAAANQVIIAKDVSQTNRQTRARAHTHTHKQCLGTAHCGVVTFFSSPRLCSVRDGPLASAGCVTHDEKVGTTRAHHVVILERIDEALHLPRVVAAVQHERTSLVARPRRQSAADRRRMQRPQQLAMPRTPYNLGGGSAQAWRRRQTAPRSAALHHHVRHALRSLMTE